MSTAKTGTAVATMKPARPIDVVRAELNSQGMRQQLQMALPKHIDVDRFNRVLITAISQNPSLLEADRKSLFAAAMTAAQLGLLTDGVLGQAYLVPYKGKVTLIPGYKGLIALARQSGEISSIDADVICERDQVDYVLGDESRFVVRPTWGDRGEPIGVFAVAKFKDGGIQRAVMTKDEVEAIRRRSPNGNSSVWRDNWSEMAKKTAIRRLAKMLPLSTEAQKAFGLADAADQGATAKLQDGEIVLDPPAPEPAPAKRSGSARLDSLAARQPYDPETGEVIDIEVEAARTPYHDVEPADAPHDGAEEQPGDLM